jgi:hypothetical protein
MPTIKPKVKQQNGASPFQNLDSNYQFELQNAVYILLKKIIANTGLHDEEFRIH